MDVSHVFTYCDRNQMANKFYSETKQAGKGWMIEFLKHPHDLSLWKPESMSIQRAIAFDKSKGNTFFSIFEKLYLKLVSINLERFHLKILSM